MTIEIAIACGLLAVLLGCLEAGFRVGRRAATTGDSPAAGQIGAVQGATLGLLGLLLGFSFAGAASRFLEKQDLIVSEANAIGTAYLRADVLHEPHRSLLREQLALYVQHRLEVSKRLRYGLNPADTAQISRFHSQIWKAAIDGVAVKPDAMLVVLNPINDLIDMHATRIAAGRKHLPIPVMALLIGCSLLAVAVIGYGCGLARRRAFPMTGALAILIGAALWITIDLDHPRAGVMQLSDAPLEELDLQQDDP